MSAPVLGAGFAASGEWLAPGAVSLDWDSVAGASGFEVMWHSPDGWVLLSEREPVGGAVVEFDGSSAAVGGLPQRSGEYWFAVRARSAWGTSEWSHSFSVAVPAFAAEPASAVPVFDPFTAPTRTGIDLERLGQAAMSITPGRADCAAAPALGVAGVTMVDPPADLGDPDAPLTVAEVVRIAGGCLLVEYADLAGRTVDQVRSLLTADPTVFAVSEPIRGIAPDHDKDGNDKDTAHYDDTTPDRRPGVVGGGQWHLTQDITGVPKERPNGDVELGPNNNPVIEVPGLWQGWVAANPVTVAVLDTGVDVRHPDLVGQLAPDRAGGCHGVDGDGHGTRMAGVIAAEAGNGAHVAGVAPKARILPVSVKMKGNTCTNAKKALSPLSPPAAVAEAVNRGARVINMSFGGSSRHDMAGLVAGGVEIPGAKTYEAVLRTASMLGVVAVASAGNCGDDNTPKNDVWDWDDPRRSCAAHNDRLRRPALYSKRLVGGVVTDPVYADGDVIAVAAVAHDGTRWAGSTANEFVDIAAPGDDILTTNRCERSGAPNSPLVCGTATRMGTSPAAAFVSGVVAHMLNRHPQATVGQVRAALERSATDEGDSGRDDEFGYGIVDPAKAVEALGDMIGALSAGDPSGGFKSVVAGGRFSCGVLWSGQARCWGDQRLAGAVPGGQVFSQVSAASGNADYGCGLRPLGPGDDRGTVLCWSGVWSRVLGFVPQGAFTQLAAGRLRTCGLRPAGGVVCWENMTGPRVSGMPSGEFVELSGGWDHWCARRADDSVACWGGNADGKAAALAGEFSDVSAGGSHTCAVRRSDGAVVCWGAAGAVGGVPAVGDGLGFYAVDAGYGHSCALEQVSESGAVTLAFGGRAVCWGDNAHGQADAPAGWFTQVSAGWRHTCGLRWTGRVVCWGDDSFGQGSAAELEGLSLANATGTELLRPVFDPATVAYLAESPKGMGALAVDRARDSDEIKVSPADADPAAPGHQVALEHGAVIEVKVASLWGLGARRVYRVHVAESPRLGSLAVHGPDCLVTDPCPALVLDPVFDPDTGYYETVAPAHWNRITVSHTVVGGPASITPADADPDTPGHQVALSNDRGFAAVSTGGQHSCGIKADRSVVCWGRSFRIRERTPSGSFSAVSTGYGHSCGIRTDQAAVCWGANHHGQSDAPAGQFTAVAAGNRHSCGVRNDRSVVCWGSNRYGESDAPTGLFAAVSAGDFHACGIRNDRSVVCWGNNSRGQSDAPAGAFTSVSAGAYHSCGVRNDRSVVCWGSNGSGQSNAPSGRFTAVSAGRSHSCGVRNDRSVVCWGSNGSGQSDAPTGMFTAVSAGAYHSCGVTTGGAVVCWGQDAWGQQAAPAGRFSAVSAGYGHSCGIGDDRSAVCWGRDDNGQSDPPAGKLAAVSAGGFHTCGIKADQTVACWGYNRWRRQSDPPSGSFSAVSAGWLHTCGIKADQTVACWGYNSSGQADAPTGAFTSVSAGNGHTCAVTAGGPAHCWGRNTNGQTSAPAGAFTSVSAGANHSCGIKTDQTAVCWGDNNSHQSDPPAGKFTAIAAGTYHTCAITASDSAVMCWGSNRYGESDAPAGRFTSVSAGTYHTCATEADQSAVCWGARPPELEPAGPQAVVVSVQAEVPAAAAALGAKATEARYVVFVERPQPPRPQPRTTAAGQQTTGTGSVVGAGAENPETGDEQRRLYDQQRHEQHLEDLLFEEQAPPRPRGHIPAPRAYPLPVQPAESGDQPAAAAQQQAGPATGIAGTGVAGTSGGAFSCPAGPGGSDAVVIGDPVLRAGVERALGKTAGGAVTAAELGALGELALAAERGRVSGLSGLEHASGLRVLDLFGHDIADLGPLSCLDGLSALELGRNQIADLGPLKGLTSLASLGLGGNRIADISPLAGLSGLRSLRLHANRITDVSALSGLAGLTSLDVSFNQIADAGPLRSLTGLASLGLGGNQIAGVGPLSGLSVLGALYLFDNEIAEVSPLSGLSGLRTLWVDGNRIAGAAVLAGLSGLGYLDARYNLIADTSPLDALSGVVHAVPQGGSGLIGDAALLAAVQAALGLGPHQHPTAQQLAGLRSLKRAGPRHDPTPIRSLAGLEHATGLHTLEVPSNQITDLSPLSGLVGLRKLDVQANCISDFSPLAGLAGLEHLNVIQNNISDISSLPALPALKTLFLDINRISDLSPLRGRHSLDRLSLSGNQISDLSPLQGLTGLERLTLSHNQIADIEPLKGLTALIVLRLTQNRVTNLGPLSGLNQLFELRLAHNRITNIEPIAALPRLWFLDISHNQITDTTPLNGHPTLRHLYT